FLLVFSSLVIVIITADPFMEKMQKGGTRKDISVDEEELIRNARGADEWGEEEVVRTARDAEWSVYKETFRIRDLFEKNNKLQQKTNELLQKLIDATNSSLSLN
ncbi:hypothetical protein PMAYCL1PPCAC_09915, partial [Pristionchus mayeri]